jgi:hypothetical protein
MVARDGAHPAAPARAAISDARHGLKLDDSITGRFRRDGGVGFMELVVRLV